MEKQNVLNGLLLNIDILDDFINSMPSDALYKKRGDNWTIFQHLEHLLAPQELLLQRIQKFIDEPVPVMTPYNPEDRPKTNTEIKPAEVLAKLKDIRTKQVELLKKCPDELWKKKAVHPEYTDYSLRILARHIYMHDGFHMYRMEDLWILKDEFLTEL